MENPKELRDLQAELRSAEWSLFVAEMFRDASRVPANFQRGSLRTRDYDLAVVPEGTRVYTYKPSNPEDRYRR